MQKALLNKIFSRMTDGTVIIKYWDGTDERYGVGDYLFTIHLRRPLFGLKFAKDPLLEICEAYMDGFIEIEGNLTEVIRWALANQNVILESPPGKFSQKMVSKLNKSVSLRQQKKDVQFHYDLGNDFYSLWLDDTMSYSCAYFHSPEDELTKAQLQKIDHILKKLQLKEGEKLLDIGSGWGWLIIRASKQYGVKSLGITLSREQYEKTKERIKEAGLEHLAEVRLMDYRALQGSRETFDKVASVGMLEHVGQANVSHFTRILESVLKPQGLALVHTITKMTEGGVNTWMEKYIFPGGYVPSLREIVWLLPEHDFHTLDIESLRMHYALTLDRWAENFEGNIEKVRRGRGERFVRMWRLYLRSCAESFRTSGLDVHQILFSKGLDNNLPWTREHLYQ